MTITREQIRSLVDTGDCESAVLKEGEKTKNCSVVTCPQINSNGQCGIFYHPDRCRHAQMFKK